MSGGGREEGGLVVVVGGVKRGMVDGVRGGWELRLVSSRREVLCLNSLTTADDATSVLWEGGGASRPSRSSTVDSGTASQRGLSGSTSGWGVTGSHRRRRSRLHLGWGFVRRPSQRGPTGRGFVVRSVSGKSFGRTAFGSAASDFVPAAPPPHGKQPYCV